jgi:hypothetical protein
LPKQSTTFATCDLRLSSIGGFWAFEFKSPADRRHLLTSPSSMGYSIGTAGTLPSQLDF